SAVERVGGSLDVQVPPATLRGTEGLLRQVFANLVDNAVKYRRPNVPLQVEITGRVEGNVYELHISDNGMGMSAEDCAKAFEPFYRARRSREIVGTGLGLSIVKRVVEASGGEVSVHSELDRGTSF